MEKASFLFFVASLVLEQSIIESRQHVNFLIKVSFETDLVFKSQRLNVLVVATDQGIRASINVTDVFVMHRDVTFTDFFSSTVLARRGWNQTDKLRICLLRFILGVL